MTSLTFTIPPSLWLTSNRAPNNRGHRARQVGDLQAIAALIAREQNARPIVGPVTADWTIRYPKGVARSKGDAANSQPTTKALLDGLVRAGVLEEDGPLHIVSETFRRGLNLCESRIHRVVLTLTPLVGDMNEGASA